MIDTLQAIRADSTRFSDALLGADLDAPVPSCPEWSVRALIEHLGGVQRFWADTVRTGDSEQPTRVEHVTPRRADDLAEWMRASTELLLAALTDSSDDAPCWTWWGEPRTSGAVARHQVHESAVHRWDAQSAVGTPAPIDAAVADDGVGEFLEVVVGPAATTLLGSVSLVSEDTGGEWIVGDQRGTRTVVRASASDLVLLLYGRLPHASVTVEGDSGLLRDLLDSADTE